MQTWTTILTVFPNMAWKVSPHTKQEQSVDTAVYALLKKNHSFLIKCILVRTKRLCIQDYILPSA